MNPNPVLAEVRKHFSPSTSSPLGTAARGAGPEPGATHFFSCRCARIKRAAASVDLCPECHQPLCLEWNADPRGPQSCDAQVWLDRFTDLAVRNLESIRSWINEHRPELRLADVQRCLGAIDVARKVSLAGLQTLSSPKPQGSSLRTGGAP